jgi:hypothetical protein
LLVHPGLADVNVKVPGWSVEEREQLIVARAMTLEEKAQHQWAFPWSRISVAERSRRPGLNPEVVDKLLSR